VKNNSISKIHTDYELCPNCTKRLISKNIYKNKSIKKCFICKNIFDNLNSHLENIFEKILNYDFKTFQIGVTLQPSYLDRDDFIKSKFKIQGVENIKFAVLTELAKKISKTTSTVRKMNQADLIIEIVFKDESCTIRTKPLFIYGRYKKTKRNLRQRQDLCKKCNGIGCHNCEFKGVLNEISVESKISNFFKSKFQCSTVKINWIGGEEQFSLVLGNGRPFFAKLNNPKKRNRILRNYSDHNGISLSELRKLKSQPKGSVPFKSEISATIVSQSLISSSQLKNLKKLERNELQFFSKGKLISKKIYKINYKKTAKNKFNLNLFLDGGIPIKSLIEMQEITPNVSNLLGSPCRCEKFDFKRIEI
tara:strand:- start:968 stop:2056 length:1089 start_codon:yes stop_codon:yes gene_type:complete